MNDNRQRRVFIPVMLAGLLAFGSVAAEAKEHREDRVTRGALIGATLGTLLQVATGHNQGRDVLGGALVGGALGAAVADGTRYSHRGYGYRQEAYPVEVYRPDPYGYQGGYVAPSAPYTYRDESYYRGEARRDDQHRSRRAERDRYRDGDRCPR